MKSLKKYKINYNLKRYFLSGLLIWIPIWVTIIVIKFFVELLDQTILLIPIKYRIPGLGVIITLLTILLTGMLVANFIGKKIIYIWDNFIDHIPMVRSIHTGVKQVLQTVITPEGQAFRKVVLVEFPRAGVWSVAFITGENTKEFERNLKNKALVTVFIPTTPNITSGFLIITRSKDIIEIDMNINDALKYIISLGVVQSENK